MSTPARVLIAGCGYVGTALGDLLVADGHEVVGLRRDPSKLPESFVRVAADFEDPATFAAIPQGIVAVVLAASPPSRDDDGYRLAYVDGPAQLLDFLEERGDPLERAVLTTSTGVYGQTDGSWVDEESDTSPTHFSGVRMLEGERALRSRAAKTTALRLGGIYGPERTSFIRRVRDGEARTPRNPRFTNRIHRDDCAGALRHILSLPQPADVYVGVDRDPAELGEVQRWLAAELGVAAPPLEDEDNQAAEGRRARSNKRCRSDRLVESGYEFRYPTFREGYAAIVAELGP